jgi:putative RNA 2'-phosphotransferase
MPSKVKLSKFMSLVLRHKPDSIGLSLDDGGWADINELIDKASKVRVNLTPSLILDIVATSDKQRFCISPDGDRIRANQGHTVTVELGLHEAEPPNVLFHGTAWRNLSAIRREGIKRGNRNYVHLSKDKETALKVAARHGRPVVLKVLTAKMFRDGIHFFISKNGVWLTDYVSPEYILSE